MTKKVCILGGGFGGLYTALRLNELYWSSQEPPEITIIDKNDRFLFSPLLYELVTGELQSWEIAPPIEELLADTKIKFKQANITKIEIESKEIQCEKEISYQYDQLVVALGGKTPVEIVPGASSHAITFRNLSDAYQLQEKLRIEEKSNKEKIRVAIVGGGYSGVELACKIADRLGERGRVRLIDRGENILKNSSQFNQEIATKTLESKRIWMDLQTEVESVEADQISLLYKGKVDTIPVDIVLWTVGNQVLELIKTLPLKSNQNGQLKVNSTLQVIDHPEIFALGDAAECLDKSGQKVPTTAQAALQQADYCAWNIWASITGRPLLPFSYQNLGEMMTLGIDNATLVGLGIKLAGIPASVARRLVYLYRMPTLKHKLNVGLNWATQPLLELINS